MEDSIKISRVMERRKPIDSIVVFTIAFFTSLCFFITKTVNTLMGRGSSVNSYYLKSDYKDQADLFDTLLSRPEKLFVWCCDCIQFYALKMGISYEQLNIDLFVIIQPLMILMFAALFIIQSAKLRRYYNQGSRK